MLDASKLTRKPKADPIAKGLGRAGVLPVVEDIERALLPLDDGIWRKMQHDYHHGREKGHTTHIEHLDKCFRWMPGYTNVVTGWGGHGKSQFFFEKLLLQAVFSGKKSAVHPAENLPAHRFYDGLIHTLTGRPTDQTFANCLSIPEYKRAKDFIRDHFIVVAPPMGMPFTPAHLLAYFEQAIAKYGVEFCMIDPWNKADHSAMGRMGGVESYLAHVLGLCTQWSQTTGQNLVITAHPKRVEEMGFGKARPVPDGASISGGQMWENMAHTISAVVRPFKHLNNGDNRAAFYSHKIKDEKLVAKTGSVGGTASDGTPPMVPLVWDEITNRYRWGHTRENPLDADDVRKIWASAPEPAPQPQLDLSMAPSVTTPADFDAIPADRLPNGARAIRSLT